MKVSHAEEIGARAVLIMDNKDGEEVGGIIMVDNGTGGNINIPSYLISKQSGGLLKKYLQQENHNQHVMVKLTFEMNLHHTVSYEIYFSSGN